MEEVVPTTKGASGFQQRISCSMEILLVDVEFPVKYCDRVAVCVYNIVEVTGAIDSLKSPRLEASALTLDIREACDNWDEISDASATADELAPIGASEATAAHRNQERAEILAQRRIGRRFYWYRYSQSHSLTVLNRGSKARADSAEGWAFTLLLSYEVGIIYIHSKIWMQLLWGRPRLHTALAIAIAGTIELSFVLGRVKRDGRIASFMRA